MKKDNAEIVQVICDKVWERWGNGEVGLKVIIEEEKNRELGKRGKYGY